MRVLLGAVGAREWREARGEGKRGQRMGKGPLRGGINPVTR